MGSGAIELIEIPAQNPPRKSEFFMPPPNLNQYKLKTGTYTGPDWLSSPTTGLPHREYQQNDIVASYDDLQSIYGTIRFEKITGTGSHGRRRGGRDG